MTIKTTSKFIIILVLSLFYFLSFTQSRSVDKRTDVDYLIFRQIWPEPTCMFPGPHTCKIDKNVTTWVVHGLWPAENNSIGPNFCNASLPFNPNAIQPILGLLLKYWPNLYTDTQIESFWEHEWTKHGTCALSINSQIKNQDDYFSVSLGLRDKFDFGPILAEANIIPSDTLLYSLDNILNAIQAKLGVRPLTTCFIQKDSNIQIFSQMQICFDKDFSLIDCRDQVLELAKIAVDNTPQETGCSHTRPISYPIIKH